MSTIDRDPKANQPPIQESQLPDINNVLPEAPEMLPTTRREVKEAGSKEKKKFPLGAKITAGIAGLALIGGGVAVVANQAPKQEPVAEAPADPIDTGEIATPTEPEVFQRPLDQLAISADMLNSQDELATQFIEERVTEWTNYGATPENVALAYDFDGGIRAFAEQLAAQSDQAFIDSLVVSGWENTPLKSWVDGIKKLHVESLVLYFSTARPDLERFDEMPFTLRGDYTSIESYLVNADGSVTLQTIEHTEDNSDKNTVGENPNYTVEGLGNEYRVIRTFVNENGVAKLASIESVVI